MTRRRKSKVEYFNVEDELPIVGTLADCHVVAENRWRGTDVDGSPIEINGVAMPKYLLVPLPRFRKGPGGDLVRYGLIEVRPRDKVELRGWYGISRTPRYDQQSGIAAPAP
jgi:hypothetical protein